MNVAVVSTNLPFERREVDDVRAELSRQLVARGHSVEQVRIPLLSRDAGAALDALVAIRFIHIRLVDLVVALDFPAYFIRHPRTVVWAISEADSITGPDDVQGLFANAEATFFREVRAVATSRRAFAARLRRASISADLLPIPGADGEWSYTVDRLLGYAEQRRPAHGPAVRMQLSKEALALLSEACDRVGTTMAALGIEPSLPVVTRVAATLSALGDANA